MGVASLGAADPDSVGVAGQVTTPAAAAAIATIGSGSLPAGQYEVRYGFMLSGTAEALTANLRLRKASTTVVNLLPSITGAAPVTGVIPRLTLDGTQSLSIQAIALATTGAIYSAWITATRVG